jgi:hypothetical protein
MLIVHSLFENDIFHIFQLKESNKRSDVPYILNSIYENGLGVEDNYPVGEHTLAGIRKRAVFVPSKIEQKLFFK